MRVLLAHNHYRSDSPSGEDAVFESECRMLADHGVEVVRFERFNDAIDGRSLTGRVRTAVDAVWSRRSQADLSHLLAAARPDVAHFHNTFPLMSPSVYAACRAHDVPVVQTLHNYRLVCPGALLLRNNAPCERCVSGSLANAVLHRCYRRSATASATVAAMLWHNRRRGVYRDLVARYVALTRFAAGRFEAGGLPPDRIEVKPNFLADPPHPGAGRGGYAVYVGRLSAEKGVETLLDAWKGVPGVRLRIVGDGPLLPALRETAARERLNVEFLGRRDRQEVLAILGDAALMVLPSLCYEGFPMTVVEAYACGTPVAASHIGSLAEVVEEGRTGFTFPPGDPTVLAAAMVTVFRDPKKLGEMRAAVRRRFDASYTAVRNFEQLMGIYKRAREDRAEAV